MVGAPVSPCQTGETLGGSFQRRGGAAASPCMRWQPMCYRNRRCNSRRFPSATLSSVGQEGQRDQPGPARRSAWTLVMDTLSQREDGMTRNQDSLTARRRVSDRVSVVLSRGLVSLTDSVQSLCQHVRSGGQEGTGWPVCPGDCIYNIRQHQCPPAGGDSATTRNP